MTYDVKDVAQFVVNYSNEKSISITNLKLQKLLYYIQAAFLVKKGEPCFYQSIVNWRHGPVVVEIYEEFKQYGSRELESIDETTIVTSEDGVKFNTIEIKYDENKIHEKDKEIIKTIINVYKNSNPWDMVEKTHEESPWMHTNNYEEITIDSIKNYFLKNEDRIYQS